jgi:hypothetical protein
MIDPRFKVKEADILFALRKYLRMRGWYVIRHHNGMGCHKGLSDLTAIKDGKTVYLECKSPRGGKQSPGATYHIVASFEDVVKVVDGL